MKKPMFFYKTNVVYLFVNFEKKNNTVFHKLTIVTLFPT